MELQRFPSDSQKCYMKMLTYMSRSSVVNATWLEDQEPVQKDLLVELPDYSIERVHGDYCGGVYSVGTFSCLMAIFELKRFSGFHFFQTFIPSTFIFVMSWIGFWITPRAVPARVTLSITTFLALTTLSQGVKVALPAVSYATAIDIWTTICTVFVFAALLEFAVAYHLWEEEFADVYSGKIAKQRANESSSLAFPWPAPKKVAPKQTKEAEMTEKDKITAAKVLEKWMNRGTKYSKVDRFSRVLFPFAFLVCNIVFWFKYPPNLNIMSG